MQSIVNIKIGIECHIQIRSQSKLFSKSQNKYEMFNNTFINSVDLGYPGTLPSLNKQIIKSAVYLCHLIHTHASYRSCFIRKHYFYADLPKSYQITQLREPISKGGFLLINTYKKVRIDRIQIEEDTAKSYYKNFYNYINYNRSGVPLIELITIPSIKNDLDAMAFVKTLKNLVKNSKISTGNMNEGALRIDINVSLQNKNSILTPQKIEIKNLNSVKFVGQAIRYEVKRQLSYIKKRESLKTETRFWNVKTHKTHTLRNKEIANDYRYIYDSNIPTINLSFYYLNKQKVKDLAILKCRSESLSRIFHVKPHLGLLLVKNNALTLYALNIIKKYNRPYIVLSWITDNTDYFINSQKLKSNILHPYNFLYIIRLIDQKLISKRKSKNLFNLFLNIKVEKSVNFRKFIKKNLKYQITSLSLIKTTVDSIIKLHTPNMHKNQSKVINFLTGIILKKIGFCIDPKHMKMFLLNNY